MRRPDRHRLRGAAPREEWTTFTYTPTGADSATSTLSAATTSVNLPDLEAGATYEAQVRALTGEEGAGPWSDTGEGTANRPPAATAQPLYCRQAG